MLDFESEKALGEWQRRASLISQVFSERPLSAYLLREIEGRVLAKGEGNMVGKGMAGLSLGERTPVSFVF